MIKLKLDGDIDVPDYQTEGSSGFDLQALDISQVYQGARKISSDKLDKLKESFIEKGSINIRPAERILIGTGITVADLEKGYEIQIRSRSSVAGKRGLFISNQPGTIDSDYRGEIFVSIYNSNKFLTAIFHKERIAQAVICKVEHPELEITEQISSTQRGDGGFGSTN